MITDIGLNPDFKEVMKQIIHMEYAAYDTCENSIQRIDNHAIRTQLINFSEEHQRHIRELITLAEEMGLGRHFILNKKNPMLSNKTRLKASDGAVEGTL